MHNEECCSKKIREAGMDCKTWTCSDVGVTPVMCKLAHLKLRESTRVRACVCVRIKKVIWELRRNINCSCYTDSRLAD